MSFIISDRVQETTNTTGTGTLTLSGAVPQHQSFSSGIGNGNSTYYSIIDGNGLDWEIGVGTVSSGTLTRTTILTSSNANAHVSLSAFGPHLVFADAPAAAIQLISSIPSHTILSNLTGSAAAPLANSLTAIIDACIDNTQGDILYRAASNWAALGPGTSGQVLTTQGPSANPTWVTLGLSSLPSQINNTILSNISGITSTPSANSLTAIIDSCIDNTQGDILYRSATVWTNLAPGTAGYFLQTGGASANPSWALAVTSVVAGTGLSGGTITSTGTIALATIATHTILSNVTGGTTTPSANTLTAIIDACIDNTQGDILYRSASAWTNLAPGTSGQFLQTQGTSANPVWATIGLSTLPTQGNNTILANISGITASPLANTLTAIIDSCISSTQGVILYRGASNWAALATGTSGYFLQTQGASANPQWALAVTSVVAGTGLSGGTITSTGTIALATIATHTILSNVTGGTTTPSANTLSDVIDTLSSTQGVILYRDSTAWAALSVGISGQFLQTQGSAANPVWANIGLSSFPSIANHTILSNISGGSTYAAANTLSDIIDSCIDNTQGDILYRSGSAWTNLTAGTSGNFLMTQGAAANPMWSSAVTSVATGSGLTGGTITTTGTIAFANIANGSVLANISGISAPAIANTLTAIIDTITTTQGALLYRGSSTWTSIGPGTSGQYLKTFGPSANPQWVTFAYTDLPTITSHYILANITAGAATPSANTLTAIIDAAIDNTQGDILYRSATVWTNLTPGTSGYFLQTQGASANPQWAAVGLSSLASQSDSTILSNISGGSTTPSANSLTAIIDHCIDNTQGDILYRSATVWTNLTPGTSGQYLKTQGASANPVWSTIALTSLATQSNNTILSNISGISATPSANTLTGIIDSCISSTQGVILYRAASNWAALATGTSGAFLMTQGSSANPTWQTIGYGNIPAEIQNSLAVSTLPGLPPTNTKVIIMPIIQNTQVPANFANSAGYCGTNATGTFVYTVSYVRSGSPTTIGTITFSSGGGSTPAFSTQSAVNLVSGDIFIITTQTSADGTLADVGLTMVLLKQ